MTIGEDHSAFIVSLVPYIGLAAGLLFAIVGLSRAFQANAIKKAALENKQQ